MEEGHSTKADAATTRKRRSSILKSQRTPRTPFSELEFKVATPTDTAKSRRVSFSRRTGVAEFATNEATTTWKNFYEEHNKSLESSGNDSEANGSRRTGALGSRRSFFDKQFQEVEGVDFVETLNPRNPNFNTSVSQINFTNQITALDCTETDKKLEVPQQHFELSSFTDHKTKLFEDDIQIPIMGEVSDRIDLNFSMVQTIGAKQDKDDLEELQRDFQQGSSNINCPGVFRDGKDMSEYIEFDLNTTRAFNNVSDMSITDTILSPKVQNVSKRNSVLQITNSNNKDWVADKENIAINPYAAPRETENFAINEEPDKVLVFDGKRLTIQNSDTSKTENKTVTNTKEPQRKTIVLNVHDDLPNFVDELSVSKQLAHKFDNNDKSTDDMSNISMTQAVPTNIISGQVTIHDRRRTILFNTYNGDMSITQPNTMNIEQNVPITDKRKTIVFEDDAGEISVTQGLPAKIFDISQTNSVKRKTIIYTDSNGDVSVTQALPIKVITQELSDVKTNEAIYNDTCDISVTKAVPKNIILVEDSVKSKRNTIVFQNTFGDISITQALPSNLLYTQKSELESRNESLYVNDISMTQALPANIILSNGANTDRCKTTVCDNNFGDISCTQALPSNIILQQPVMESTRKDIENTFTNTNVQEETSVIDNKTNISTNETILKQFYEDENKSVPSNIILQQPIMESTRKDTGNNFTSTNVLEEFSIIDNKTNALTSETIPKHTIGEENKSDKRTTMLIENGAADISMSEAIPSNILNIQSTKRKTILLDQDIGDISVTKALPSNILIDNVKETTKTIEQDDDINHSLQVSASAKIVKSMTIFFEDGAPEISMTEVIPTDISNRLIDQNTGDVSVTQAIPTNIIINKEKETTIVKQDAEINDSLHVSALDQSLKNKTRIVDSKIMEAESEIVVKEPEKVSIPNMSMKENLSKTQDVLDQISAIIDCPNENKLISDNFESLPQTRYLLSKPIDILSNTNFEQASKNEDVLTKPNQNVLIYQASTNHGNIYSRKRNIKEENASEPESSLHSSTITSNNSVFSKQSDIAVKYVSTTQSIESRNENTYQPITSDENLILENAEFPKLSVNASKDPSSSNFVTETNDSQLVKSSPDKIKSVLHELLDMSNAITDVQVDNKEVTAKPSKSHQLSPEFSKSFKPTPESPELSKPLKSNVSLASNDSVTAGDDRVILVIHENDAEKDKETDTVKVPILCKIPKPLVPEDFEREQANGTEVQGIDALKTDVAEEIVKTNEIIEVDKSYVKNETISVLNMQSDAMPNFPKTNSDESAKGFVTIARDDSDETNVPTVESNTIDVQCRIDERRSSSAAIIETKRKSYAPRQSMINREDFLSNISMAQQILQNTKLDIECSMNDATTECTLDDFEDIEESRTSSDVVKKLQFEDDSVIELSVPSNITKDSPLRKHYPEPESQDTPSKQRVIPSYLKYVSEELKDLMNDLVKPTADTMPFEGLDDVPQRQHLPNSLNAPNREVSMCSNQIQANLVASSQIDVTTELTSETESLNNLSNTTQHSKMKSVSFASAIKMPDDSDADVISQNDAFANTQSVLQVSPKIFRPHSRTTIPASNPIIVFDDQNPLNNILLSPVTPGEYLKHEPFLPKISPNNEMPERSSMQYHLKSITGNESPLQSGDTAEICSTQSSVRSSLEKTSLTSQSVSMQFGERKDTTVNTIIAMRGNKELLKVSSLTLVDDVCRDESEHMVTDETEYVTSKESVNVSKTKGKKRFFSPSSKNKNGVSSADSTPNPTRKMIKMSPIKRSTVSSSDDISVSGTSNGLECKQTESSTLELIYSSESAGTSEKPKKKRFSMFKKRKSKNPESESSINSFITPQTSDVANEVLVKKILKKETPDLSPPPISRRRSEKHVKFPRAKQQSKMGKNYRVQHVLTEYVVQSNILLQEYVRRENLDDTNESKNEPNYSDLAPIQNESSTDTNSTVTSKTSVDPYFMEHGLISKTVSKIGCSVNVIPQINVLPFMGTYKCEWESSSNDTWSFRLLHRRLRLCVRFEHKIDNALMTCVRTDTPIQAINLHNAHEDKGNNIGLSCVKYAAKSILYIISRDNYDNAGCVPKLLRKSAAVAGIAMNWARAMYDARLRLAFDLTENDELSLKVANIPLRSVWEVRMRLESVTKDDGEIPWPKAMDVQVKAIVADDVITREEIEKALRNVPNNWGHVPHTVWAIFKYLKNKRKDDLSMFPTLKRLLKS